MTSEVAPHLVRVRVAEMPDGYHDVSDLFERHPNPSLAWELMIASARNGTTWRIDHLDSRHDIESAEGKAEACYDIIDALLAVPPVSRATYVRELSEKLGESERDVRMQLNEIMRERSDHYREHPEDKPFVPPEDRLEDVLDLS